MLGKMKHLLHMHDEPMCYIHRLTKNKNYVMNTHLVQVIEVTNYIFFVQEDMIKKKGCILKKKDGGCTLLEQHHCSLAYRTNNMYYCAFTLIRSEPNFQHYRN